MYIDNLLEEGMLFTRVTNNLPSDDRVVLLHYYDDNSDLVVIKAVCDNDAWFEVVGQVYDSEDPILFDEEKAIWTETILNDKFEDDEVDNVLEEDED